MTIVATFPAIAKLDKASCRLCVIGYLKLNSIMQPAQQGLAFCVQSQCNMGLQLHEDMGHEAACWTHHRYLATFGISCARNKMDESSNHDPEVLWIATDLEPMATKSMKLLPPNIPPKHVHACRSCLQNRFTLPLLDLL